MDADGRVYPDQLRHRKRLRKNPSPRRYSALASMISVHILAEMFRKTEEQVASDIIDLHLEEQS